MKVKDEFYILEFEIKPVGEKMEIYYWPDPAWNSSLATAITKAKRFTKLGAERKLKREQELCPDGKMKVRKVEVTYSIVDDTDSKITPNGMKILSYPADYDRDTDTDNGELETVRSTIE